MDIESPLPYFKLSENIPSSQSKSEVIIEVLPTNNNSEFDNQNNIIQFDIPCTTNGLDPRQLFLKGKIVNPDNFPKQIDHSFHNLIQKIYIFNGMGEKIEVIDNYGHNVGLYFDTRKK